MLIIKIGGGEEVNIEGIAKDIASLEEEVVVVHGANILRDELLKRLGINKEVITSVSGYSSVYTTEEMIDIILMSYAGVRNKRIVQKFIKAGIKAIGLTGADGALIVGEKNKGIRAKKGEKTVIVRDLSGKPKGINTSFLLTLIREGYIPVITIPIISKEGELLNTENDEIVSLMAESLKASTVIQLIEERGLLRDVSNPSSFIPLLNLDELRRLKEAQSGRIKRKLLAIEKILLSSNNVVVIVSDSRVSNPIKSALNKEGTVITYK